VTNLSLAQSYLQKARTRLKILQVLLDEEAFSDVVREAQEIVELALKGMLRQVGVEPPKWHDVGGFLLEFADRFPELERARLELTSAPAPRAGTAGPPRPGDPAAGPGGAAARRRTGA
jgi:HEPN domain-containing protein